MAKPSNVDFWMREKLIAVSRSTNVIKPAASKRRPLPQPDKKAEPLEYRKLVEGEIISAADNGNLREIIQGVTHRDSLHSSVTFMRTASLQQFLFDEQGNRVPLVAGGNCYNRMFLADDKTAAAVEAWSTASDSFKNPKLPSA